MLDLAVLNHTTTTRNMGIPRAGVQQASGVAIASLARWAPEASGQAQDYLPKAGHQSFTQIAQQIRFSEYS